MQPMEQTPVQLDSYDLMELMTLVCVIGTVVVAMLIGLLV